MYSGPTRWRALVCCWKISGAMTPLSSLLKSGFQILSQRSERALLSSQRLRHATPIEIESGGIHRLSSPLPTTVSRSWSTMILSLIRAMLSITSPKRVPCNLLRSKLPGKTTKTTIAHWLKDMVMQHFGTTSSAHIGFMVGPPAASFANHVARGATTAAMHCRAAMCSLLSKLTFHPPERWLPYQ